jgi:hypothetical protein
MVELRLAIMLLMNIYLLFTLIAIILIEKHAETLLEVLSLGMIIHHSAC